MWLRLLAAYSQPWKHAPPCSTLPSESGLLYRQGSSASSQASLQLYVLACRLPATITTTQPVHICKACLHDSSDHNFGEEKDPLMSRSLCDEATFLQHAAASLARLQSGLSGGMQLQWLSYSDLSPATERLPCTPGATFHIIWPQLMRFTHKLLCLRLTMEAVHRSAELARSW